MVALVAGGCSDESPAPQTESPTARPSVHEEFLADLAAPRAPSDGGGTVRLVLAEGHDGSVMCATTGRWEFEYVAGPLGITAGGSLTFLSPQFWGWSRPQAAAPDRLGYCVVQCPGVPFEASGYDQSLFMVQFGEGGLEAGKSLRLIYGAGPAKAMADTYAERESRFYFKVDGDGDGVSSLVGDSPAIRVLPGPAARINTHLPSTAEPNTTQSLVLALLDVFANAGVGFTGTVQLESIPPGLGLPREVDFAASDGGVQRIPIGAIQPGTFRVRATVSLDENREASCLSNPMRVAAGVRPVFWGDLHGHSGLSDGTGTPTDYFAYARDVAGLDLVVLTDHDHFGVRFLDAHPKLWEEIRAAVGDANRPGKFVALLGYEWTSWLHGHRHVLYFDGQGDILSSLDPSTTTPQGLWDALAGRDALTFAHHSAGGPVATDWSYTPDPLLEPVTEVMSVHGSSEAWDSPSRIYGAVRGNFVRDQLERGVRLGFVGSGDSHDGHPGHAHLAPNAGYRQARPDSRGRRADKRLGNGGLAAVRASILEPAALLKAFRARDVYATSGPRIWLACSLAGHKMGSSVPVTAVEEPARLVVEVAACSGLERVEIVRKGRQVERIPCSSELDLHLEIELEDLSAGDFVYIRVLENDGGQAWSSPFFIEE